MIGNFPFPQKDWNGLPAMEWFTKIVTAINGVLAKLGTSTTLPVYADNAAAIAGGLVAGNFYRTGSDPDTVCVVH